MSKTHEIDYAIIKTLQVHPDYDTDMARLIFNNCSKRKQNNFTSQYGARATIETATEEDFIIFVAEQLVNLYNASLTYYNNLPNSEQKPQIFYQIFGMFYFPAVEILETISNPDVNTIAYFRAYPQKLMQACDLIVGARYLSKRTIQNLDFRTYIDLNSDINFAIGNTYSEDLKNKIKEDAAKLKGVQNVTPRRTTINKCIQDIVNGSQLTNSHNEYVVGNSLFATHDVGKRSNQEDSVLIMEHPQNPNFKIMVVSDGMGGVEAGEYASSYTVKELAKWFNNLNPDFYYYPRDVQELFNRKINEISNQIYRAKNADRGTIVSGATLVGAIITEQQTIISSVGDSRAYSVTGDRLRLITDDESQVWFKYLGENRKPTPAELDHDRFLTFSNVITKNIGDENLGEIQTHIIPNTSYDRLLLFSDGVTDLLTQERIRVLGTQHSIDEITNLIVQEAITKNAVNEYGADEFHRGIIRAGKDNATAAMYARR